MTYRVALRMLVQTVVVTEVEARQTCRSFGSEEPGGQWPVSFDFEVATTYRPNDGRSCFRNEGGWLVQSPPSEAAREGGAPLERSLL